MRQAFIAVLLCTLVVPLPAAAQQETATLIGAITDSQRAALPGTTVTARNVETGFARSATADSEGRYRIPAIPPGSYEIAAELSGFSRGLRQGVTLTVGSEVVINFELGVSNLTEVVTIVADSPIVETTTSAVQGTLRRDQIDLLPLSGRDYTNALRLVPGAAANNASYGFGGSRGRSNTWNVDGVDNSDEISGFAHQSPALDSIQEIQVLVNGFKAEYGQASGGVVNVITRSGTNQVRGSGFILFQDEQFRARSPYASRSLPEDPFQRIQYGFTAGGPVRRDRSHFFVTYEREDRDTASISTFTLPSAAQVQNASAATLQFLASSGIDIARFGAGGSQRLVRPEYVDIHKFTGRVDQQLNANQYFTIRYMIDSNDQPSGQSGTLLDYNGGRTYLMTNYVNFNHKWILSPTMLNEAYVQYGHHDEEIDAIYTSIPRTNVSSDFSLGSTTNFNPVKNHVVTLNNNLTWTRGGTRTGDHVVKAGAQIKILRSDSFFDSNFRGTWTFANVAGFLAGTPTRFTQNRGDSALARPNELYGFFAQDDWRPTRDLTVNLGLRYDYESAKTQALVNVTGEAGPGVSRDRNNVSPRIGFAWSPKGDTKQAIYGGTGLYYDQVILNIIGNARFTPPKVIGVQIDSTPQAPLSFPNPFGGTTTVPPPTVSIIDPELVTPWNWNSQVGYRRELIPDLGLDVSFLYNRGYDHVGIININLAPDGTATSTGGLNTGQRPDPNFTTKSFYTNYGDIKYKGLLVDLKKRFSRGFQGGVAYSLSKTENNSFNFVSGLQVPSQPGLSWGPDTTDRRHRVEGHAEINLPWDIQLGTILEYRSEAPMDIIANGRDLNGDGATGDWVNESLCVPRTGVVACPGFHYARNSAREVSTADANALRALFNQTPIDAFANNPKYFNVDATVQKRVRFGRHGVRVTLEAFNVFNIAQRTAPGQSIINANFGVYTAVEQPRALQFTVQYDF
jgi:outer membrane receptor protein involved in Fe transport